MDLVGANRPDVDEDAYREMADVPREFAEPGPPPPERDGPLRTCPAGSRSGARRRVPGSTDKTPPYGSAPARRAATTASRRVWAPSLRIAERR